MAGEPDASEGLGTREALVLTLSLVGLAAWSWRKWPDLLVDFGRELYVPWRLAAGELLYRDVASLFGPLSAHVNGLLFWLGGPSFRLLALANLCLLAALCAMVAQLFARLLGRRAGLLAGLLLLSMFGFAHNTETGNYNFVAPYAHEATHGLVLAVGLVAAVAWALRRPARSALGLGLAGLCLGGTLLTKPEVGLAALATAAAGTLGLLRGLPSAARPQRSAWAWAAAGSLALPLAFWLWFARALPLAEAAVAVGGAWRPLFSGAARGPFYLLVSGFADPLGNTLLLMRAAAALLLWTGAAVWLERAKLGEGRRDLLRIVLVFAGIGLHARFPMELARCFPLLSLGAAGWFLLRLRREPEQAARWLPLLMWAVLAATLLLKTLLNTHTQHYGFTLALPATLLLAVLLVELIPCELADAPGEGEVLRRSALYLLAFVALFSLKGSHAQYAKKELPVGRGADVLLTPRQDGAGQPVGPLVAQALARVEALVPPEGTFLVLPEGIILNYLSRRPNGTRYLNFMPPELEAFGHARVAREVAEAAPPVVLLVAREAREYGVGAFGEDPRFGAELLAWLRAHYREDEVLGTRPFAGGDPDAFGIAIWRRR